MTSGMRSASDSRLGVAECEAGVPGAEKSGEGGGGGRGDRGSVRGAERGKVNDFTFLQIRL